MYIDNCSGPRRSGWVDAVGVTQLELGHFLCDEQERNMIKGVGIR